MTIEVQGHRVETGQETFDTEPVVRKGGLFFYRFTLFGNGPEKGGRAFYALFQKTPTSDNPTAFANWVNVGAGETAEVTILNIPVKGS
jgi:hypothetical protein